jgi:hypothetical protein
MYNSMPQANESENLFKVSIDITRILIESVKNAAVVPAFFEQVAASMINYASVSFPDTGYGQALRSAFIRHGIIPAANSADLLNISFVHNSNEAANELTQIPVSITEYGLDIDKITINSRVKQKIFNTKGRESFIDHDTQTSAANASKAFIEHLITCGQLKINDDITGVNKKAITSRPNVSSEELSYTHELQKEGNDYVLKRVYID